MGTQAKITEIMSDEQIIELFWKRDEQAISQTDIKYKSSNAFSTVRKERNQNKTKIKRKQR